MSPRLLLIVEQRAHPVISGVLLPLFLLLIADARGASANLTSMLLE